MTLESRLLDMGQELQRRLDVRSSLAAWAKHNGFEPAAHHRLIIQAVEAFLESDDEVLLLFAPPGSAKSTYISILLPSWYLARHPTHAVLAATHSENFAERWGRRVRNTVALEGTLLGVHLAGDSHGALRWGLAEGGEYYGVGAETGISGFRADLGIIDDLFGTRQDAMSEAIRQKRYDWFVDDYGNRLKPRAKRVMMNTAWHEDDVANRQRRDIESGKVKGRVITIRAMAEADDELRRPVGELLWSDQPGYDYPQFLRQRFNESTPTMWSALYQQRPIPEEGDFFKASWLHYYTSLPPARELHVYGASDYAVTSEGGDYTVHMVVGLDPEEHMYVLDVWRQQTDSSQWVEAWCDLVIEHKPLQWAEEKGQIASGVGPYLSRRARERKAWCFRKGFASTHDKAVRAQAIRGRMAMNGLYLPANKLWAMTLRLELLNCWAGKHDDQADALSLIGMMLNDLTAGAKTAPPVRRKVNDYVFKDRARSLHPAIL